MQGARISLSLIGFASLMMSLMGPSLDTLPPQRTVFFSFLAPVNTYPFALSVAISTGLVLASIMPLKKDPQKSIFMTGFTIAFVTSVIYLMMRTAYEWVGVNDPTL